MATDDASGGHVKVTSPVHAARGPSSSTWVFLQLKVCSDVHDVRGLKSDTPVLPQSRVCSNIHAARGPNSAIQGEASPVDQRKHACLLPRVWANTYPSRVLDRAIPLPMPHAHARAYLCLHATRGQMGVYAIRIGLGKTMGKTLG